MGNPYQQVIDQLKKEKWSQRQDSTLDQLSDILPLVYAVGCHDAGDFIKRVIERQKVVND
jgi:hypothetical protein